jgi:hypothetical protein
MRRPSPDFTTLLATRNATTTTSTLPLAKPAKALAGAIVPVSTAAAAASIAAVRSGNAATMTEKMAAAKMAKRCQACPVSPDGIGTSQRLSASANVAARLIGLRCSRPSAITRQGLSRWVGSRVP